MAWIYLALSVAAISAPKWVKFLPEMGEATAKTVYVALLVSAGAILYEALWSAVTS